MIIDENILEKINKYWNKFIKHHYMPFLDFLKEYASIKHEDEALRALWVYIYDIKCNLDARYSSLSIPSNFPSPETLYKDLESFQKFIQNNSIKLNSLSQNEHYTKYSLIINEAIELTTNIEQSIKYVLEMINKNNNFDMEPFSKLDLITRKFSLIVSNLQLRYNKRSPIKIDDEYDMQYIFKALLLLLFEDVRSEENTPDLVDGNARCDFFLKNEQIFIELKITTCKLTSKLLKQQIISDIAHYKNHPECKQIYFFIYDPKQIIKTPVAFEKDLSRLNHGIKIIIQPK